MCISAYIVNPSDFANNSKNEVISEMSLSWNFEGDISLDISPDF